VVVPPTPQEAIQTLIGPVHTNAASLGTTPAQSLRRERALVSRLDHVMTEVNQHHVPEANRGLAAFENKVTRRFALAPAQRQTLLNQATFVQELLLASPGNTPGPITVPPNTTPQEAIQTLIGLVRANEGSLGSTPGVSLARARELEANLASVLQDLSHHDVSQALRLLQSFKNDIGLRFVPPSAPALLAQATVVEDLILQTSGV
jgi:hypothetical protein